MKVTLITIKLFANRKQHEYFPGGTVVKSLPANAGDTRDVGLTPGSGRSPGVGKAWKIAWKIPWTEEPSGLQSIYIGYIWATEHTHTWICNMVICKALGY